MSLKSTGDGSEVFYLRAGYKYRMNNTNLDAITGISAGFGINVKGYHFDYAFVNYGVLGFTHRFDQTVKL